MSDILYFLLFCLSAYSTVRLFAYLIIANLHTLRTVEPVARVGYYRPRISVVIPAHNEELSIVRTLDSVVHSRYPRSRLEIIVADDGSTDTTAQLVQNYIAVHGHKTRIHLITQPNRGKAGALNHATQTCATGQLVMVLDADSLLDPDCLRRSASYFKDPHVVATASNVNIIHNGTLLSLAQRFEYLLSHHLKRTNTALGMEYIIGGVGSTFRRRTLKQVNFYDTDTMTEDIDLTLKIIANSSKQDKVVFAADAITYTQPVQTYFALAKQRLRWRYGRMQTFWKNRRLFLATDKRYSRLLTWYLLPSTLIYEFVIVLEPVIVTATLLYCLFTASIWPFLILVLFYGLIGLSCVWASAHLKLQEQLRLSLFVPFIYLLIFIIVTVEYITAFQSLRKLHMIPTSLASRHTTWVSPPRINSP